MAQDAVGTASVSPPPLGLLSDWAREASSSALSGLASGSLRLAFYGRMSTEDHQDPATSRAWQLMGSQALVSGHGRIAAEFFDVGRSRTVPWARRPEVSALLVALADPEREFDAVVIGSSERAFYGHQFASMAPLFEHYGVEV